LFLVVAYSQYCRVFVGKKTTGLDDRYCSEVEMSIQWMSYPGEAEYIQCSR